MAHTLTQRDHDRMKPLHPDVRLVVMDAAADPLCPAFIVVEALRTRETCMVNYGKGRTAAQCLAKGIPASYARPKEGKVTWLSDPFASMHCKQKDDFSHAVDLLPAPYDWKDVKPFELLNAAIQRAAKKRGVKIRWGADWNQNGKPREKGETDSPHWERAR